MGDLTQGTCVEASQPAFPALLRSRSARKRLLCYPKAESFNHDESDFALLSLKDSRILV